MHFKYPALLYFMFLLVIPIIIHLFQLRKFKTEYFTNVKFLKELSIQTRKSSKLKKYLLLATRLLLLALLIFAFAQPYFKSKNSDKSTNELYIILDNSFSMQAKGNKGELLRRAVEDLLEKIPENLKFSLLTCSENFWNTDIKSIQKEVQNLQYSANEFRVNQLISKIKSHKSAFNKDILIMTDAVGINANQLENTSKDNTFFEISKAQITKNISIDSVFIKQNLPDFYEISIQVKSYGSTFENIPIAIYNQNKLIAKTIVSLDKKLTVLDFKIPKSEFQGYVSLSDNSLEYDNRYYFSISKPEKSNVISIGASDKSQFLAKIFTDDEFNFSNFEISTLDYNQIEKQDAIVLNELKDIPVALQTTLKSFLDKGGNVVLIPNSDSDLSIINSFLSNFGSGIFQSKLQTEKLITKINFDHPLLKNVFEKKIDNFQYPKVSICFENNLSNSAILFFSDQTPFLSAVRKNISSLYVFSAALNKENSNFQNSPLIVPVFYKMAKNENKSGIVALKIGSDTSFIIDAKLEKDDLLKVENETESFIPLQQILDTKVALTFNENPAISGSFNIKNKNEIIRNISFNYARTESNLEDPNTNAISEYQKISSLELFFDTLQNSRSDNQIWKWFLIGSLLFLILEIIIQKFVK